METIWYWPNSQYQFFSLSLFSTENYNCRGTATEISTFPAPKQPTAVTEHCFSKLYEMLIISTVHNKYLNHPIFTTFAYLQSSSAKSRWDRLMLAVSNKVSIANKYWFHQGYQSVHDLLIKPRLLLNKAWAILLSPGRTKLCLPALKYCSDWKEYHQLFYYSLFFLLLLPINPDQSISLFVLVVLLQRV